jgi:hypothetical protein
VAATVPGVAFAPIAVRHCPVCRADDVTTVDTDTFTVVGTVTVAVVAVVPVVPVVSVIVTVVPEIAFTCPRAKVSPAAPAGGEKFAPGEKLGRGLAPPAPPEPPPPKPVAVQEPSVRPTSR